MSISTSACLNLEWNMPMLTSSNSDASALSISCLRATSTKASTSTVMRGRT